MAQWQMSIGGSASGTKCLWDIKTATVAAEKVQ